VVCCFMQFQADCISAYRSTQMRIQRRVQQPTFASTQSPTHVPFTERIITNEHGVVPQNTVIFADDSLQIIYNSLFSSVTCDPWFETRSQRCSVVRWLKLNSAELITKFLRIRAKYILTHGMEVTVPHWEVRTSMPLDVASMEIMLGLWPYRCEEFVHVVRSILQVNTCFYERASVQEVAQGGFEGKLGCWPSCEADERNSNINKDSGVKKISV